MGHTQLVGLLFIWLQCSNLGPGRLHAHYCLYIFFVGGTESQPLQMTMAITVSSRQVLVNNSDSLADFGMVESFWFTQASPSRLLCKTRLAGDLRSLA